MTPVKLASFIVALALACVSAAVSIDGLTAIFAGAFWPVTVMGAKLVAAAWLAENWFSAPGPERSRRVRLPYRAHLDHMVTIVMALADKAAGTEARLAIQARSVADLDRRIPQIDAAVEELTRLGRPVAAMTFADQKRRNRADIVATRLREAQVLASLRIDKVRIDAERGRAEADVGLVRYLAELIGMPTTDIERPVRMLTLALAAALDPMAVALLLAAGPHTTSARAG
jgi:hypothetical protein